MMHNVSKDDEIIMIVKDPGLNSCSGRLLVLRGRHAHLHGKWNERRASGRRHLCMLGTGSRGTEGG